MIRFGIDEVVVHMPTILDAGELRFIFEDLVLAQTAVTDSVDADVTLRRGQVGR